MIPLGDRKMECVLIVDQRNPERDILGAALESVGHRIAYASPKDAVIRSKIEKARLIVALVSQTQAAVAIANSIRSHADTASIPLVVCCACPEATHTARLYEAGAMAVHPLPLHLDVVVSCCHRLLCQTWPGMNSPLPGLPRRVGNILNARAKTPAACMAYKLADALGLPHAESTAIASVVPGRNIGTCWLTGREAIDERTADVAHHGYEIWQSFNHELAAIVALRYREHWDGSGVPDGLSGTEIPLPARIAAVGDAYESEVSALPCRSSTSAIHEIQRQAGTALDPHLTQTLSATLKRERHGPVVQMSTWL